MNSQRVYDLLKQKHPGFLQDKDEAWLIHLGGRERHFLKSRRGKFFLLEEDLDKCTDPEERAEIEEERLELAREVLEKIDDFKKQALDRINNDVFPSITRKTNLDNEAQKPPTIQPKPQPRPVAPKTIPEPPKKKPSSTTSKRLLGRTRAEPIILYREDVNEMQLEEDEYMPRDPSIVRNSTPLNKQQGPDVIDSTASFNVAPRIGVTHSTSKPEKDDLLKGITCNKEIAVMMELKPLIEKYDCRDRVVKCLNSMGTRNTALHSMSTILNFIESSKSLTS